MRGWRELSGPITERSGTKPKQFTITATVNWKSPSLTTLRVIYLISNRNSEISVIHTHSNMYMFYLIRNSVPMSPPTFMSAPIGSAVGINRGFTLSADNDIAFVQILINWYECLYQLENLKSKPFSNVLTYNSVIHALITCMHHLSEMLISCVKQNSRSCARLRHN